MTTINEVIERVGLVKPNAIDDKDKARLLLELDGRIYEEMIRADEPERERPREWPEDGDQPLLAPEPWDKVYDLYLTAMIEFYMREYSNYNNTVSLFNEAMGEYRAWYRRTHLPKTRGYRNVM